MRRASRRQIARGFVTTLGKRPMNIRARALADLIDEHKLRDQTALLLDDINELNFNHHGKLHATVKSARPLSPKILEQLNEMIRRHTGASEVEIEQLNDPALIGGFVLRAGDLLLDTSIKSRLGRLRSKT